MKFIALYIGNRVDHVLLFHPHQNGNNADVPTADTFIVGRQDNKDTHLFSFYHHAEKSNFDAVQSNDIVLQTERCQERAGIVSITTSGEGDEELRLNIQLKQGCKPKEIESQLDRAFEFSHGKGNRWPLTLKNGYWKATRKIRVCLSLEEGEDKYTSEVILVVAAPKDISDVVLDFGSEASQMAVIDRDATNASKDNICDVFHQMKSHLEKRKSAAPASESNSKATDYEQYESDKLFRTVFYATHDVPEVSPEPYRCWEDNPHLYMLTTKIEGKRLTQDEGCFVLPTIKIAQFGNISLPRVQLQGSSRHESVKSYGNNFFYRACVNQFIYLALKDSRRPCISIHVLMPNVYSAKTTFDNLRYMKEDIAAMLKDSTDLRHVKAVEISAVSESDASLLGAYGELQSAIDDKSLSSGNYLIIDSGRGTTDFSVVYFDKPNLKMKNLFRSGVVGAGGLITYGYLLAIIHDLLKRSLYNKQDITMDDLKNYILKVMNDDLYYRKKLMDAVEVYKKADNGGYEGRDASKEPDEKTNTLDEIPIEKMVEMAEKMCGDSTITALSPKARRLIDSCIAHLVDEIAKRLVRVKRLGIAPCKKIMLAGRAFKTRRFKEMLLEKLKDSYILPSTGDVELNYVGNPKCVSLFCSVKMTKDDPLYNGNMMSVPQMAFDRDSETVRNWLEENMYNWEQNGGKVKKRSVKAIRFVDEKLLHRQTSEDYEPGNITRNGVVNGFKIKIKARTDQIAFGNTVYSPEVAPGDYRLFNTGETIFLRNKNGDIHELSNLSVDSEQTQLAFGTLFPNVEANRISDIWMPETMTTLGEHRGDDRALTASNSNSRDYSGLTELQDATGINSNGHK